MSGQVLSVSCNARHGLSKPAVREIRILAGLGVADDAHQGELIQHLYRMKQNPNQPNLRQVHLMHAELFDELLAKGFAVAPGNLGENITTRGVDLLGLPTGARLRIGGDVVLEVTGLRNPCVQLDRFQKGLMAAVLDRAPDGKLIRKSGIMSIVLAGGAVRAGDAVEVELPPLPHVPLEKV